MASAPRFSWALRVSATIRLRNRWSLRRASVATGVVAARPARAASERGGGVIWATALCPEADGSLDCGGAGVRPALQFTGDGPAGREGARPGGGGAGVHVPPLMSPWRTASGFVWGWCAESATTWGLL